MEKNPVERLIKDGYVSIIPKTELARGSWQEINYEQFSSKFQVFNPCPDGIAEEIAHQEAASNSTELLVQSNQPQMAIGATATAEVAEIAQQQAA